MHTGHLHLFIHLRQIRRTHKLVHRAGCRALPLSCSCTGLGRLRTVQRVCRHSNDAFSSQATRSNRGVHHVRTDRRFGRQHDLVRVVRAANTIVVISRPPIEVEDDLRQAQVIESCCD